MWVPMGTGARRLRSKKIRRTKRSRKKGGQKSRGDRTEKIGRQRLGRGRLWYGKVTDPMGHFRDGRGMGTTGTVKVGEGMVMAWGETETRGQVTGAWLEEYGIGEGGDGTETKLIVQKGFA